MVGPITDEERRAGSRRLKLAFVVIVGLSAGLMALEGDASPAVFAAATGAGVVFGAVLVWVTFPGGL